ncbi:phosphopantetheine-binding protein [Streptomyces viridochromogenes]|uniref:acyl carrier protein n=1 Tax=Streptomyces viridochromogenes TaxID=1938 RepID=UPI003CC7C47C
MPPAQRFNVLLDHIRRHTATILALPGLDAVDAHRGFTEQGLDSLTALELRNRLATSTGLTLPATTVFDHPTPTALTHHLLPQLTTDNGEDTATGGADRPGAAGAALLAEFGRLEEMLTAARAEDILAAGAAERLRSLLDRAQVRGASVGGTGSAPDDAPVTARLESATTDELFDFIDNELN